MVVMMMMMMMVVVMMMRMIMMMPELLLAENMMSVVFPAPSLAWKSTRLGRHKKTKTTPRTSKGSRVASCGRSPVLNSTQQWRLQVSFGVSSCRTLAPVQKHFENTPNVHQNWRTNSINRTWNSNISLFIPMSFRCLWDFHRFSRFLCITSYRNARFQPTSLSPSRFEARCQRQRSRLSRFRHWRSVDNLRVLKMGDFHWKDIILRVFWD